MSQHILKGIPAAPGIACGRVFILDKQDFIVPKRNILKKEVPIEIVRFDEALKSTKEEIQSIQERISKEMQLQPANIFDAHLLVLEDKTLLDEVVKRIKEELLSAEYVFSEVIKKYIKIFSKIEDEYLRDRGADINDVGRRVLRNLMEENKLHEFDHSTEDLILLSHDLSPSDTAAMYNQNVIAFITDIGGRTSHTAIMAKSLGVPAVVGLKDATLRIKNQDYIIVDGRKGLVIANPNAKTKKYYKDAYARILQSRSEFKEIIDLPSFTKDNHEIFLSANLELHEDIDSVNECAAHGVGLYRTEYFYMNRVDLPTEEEQFIAYKHVVQALSPNGVTIRTLDLGGDKFISSIQIPREMYPFLGWRAIRFCLSRPDIFKTQLRAILRASAFGSIRIMYPMITGVDELRLANEILEEVKLSLKKDKIVFDEHVQVGIMIEVPSAAIMADQLAKEADFFSIGTNDLIQYTLAVDRVNEKTAHLYEPCHPAVLKMIQSTIEAAHKNKIRVSLCGEMANEPHLVYLLLGLGLNELSMPSLSILQIKKFIRSVEHKQAVKLVNDVLKLSTAEDIEKRVTEHLKEVVPYVISSED